MEPHRAGDAAAAEGIVRAGISVEQHNAVSADRSTGEGRSRGEGAVQRDRIPCRRRGQEEVIAVVRAVPLDPRFGIGGIGCRCVCIQTVRRIGGDGNRANRDGGGCGVHSDNPSIACGGNDRAHGVDAVRRRRKGIGGHPIMELLVDRDRGGDGRALGGVAAARRDQKAVADLSRIRRQREGGGDAVGIGHIKVARVGPVGDDRGVVARRKVRCRERDRAVPQFLGVAAPETHHRRAGVGRCYGIAVHAPVTSGAQPGDRRVHRPVRVGDGHRGVAVIGARRGGEVRVQGRVIRPGRGVLDPKIQHVALTERLCRTGHDTEPCERRQHQHARQQYG